MDGFKVGISIEDIKKAEKQNDTKAEKPKEKKDKK